MQTPENDGSVRVFSVPDRYAEAEAAASIIEKLVSEGCRYSDIAVIAGDVSVLCGITESFLKRRISSIISSVHPLPPSP